jgi:CxxC motif-containing protein (DUF1111 family)
MRPTVAALVLATSLTTAPLVAAGGLGEPHLPILPRTAAEAAHVASVTAPTANFASPELFEARPAGAATHFDRQTPLPFSLPSANMDPDKVLDFRVGNGFFEKLWVSSPSSTTASDGLGPLYNARGCKSCHIRDGRGHPPAGSDELGMSMVLRLSVQDALSDLPAETLRTLPNAPEPTYGLQLQDRSVAGLLAEGRMQIRYTDVPVTLGDGTVVTLRRPAYAVADAAHGPLHPQAQFSPRVAPQMIGLGLLEAIPESDILALADPDDRDGDGVSGRPNRVWALDHGQWMLGRFGWKAGQPTLAQQSSDAFLHDIGISTPIHPRHWGDCTAAQPACRTAPHGETGTDERFEIPRAGLDLVTYYTRNLAVPAREGVDSPAVLRGKKLFHDVGCSSCHRPKFVTHRLQGQPEQSFQLIWPYTDLLLHDMGEGLADNRPEAEANGREWRTPPLWGIGRTEQVSGQITFLHDGRARSLLEALLWHGGEALPAREAVRQMPADDRAALLAFLASL